MNVLQCQPITVYYEVNQDFRSRLTRTLALPAPDPAARDTGSASPDMIGVDSPTSRSNHRPSESPGQYWQRAGGPTVLVIVA